MLTQTTYSLLTVSVDTFDTQIQTRSLHNQSLALKEIRETSMERYEDSSNVRQPTVHFEHQLPAKHTTNSTNEPLYYTKSEKPPHKHQLVIDIIEDIQWRPSQMARVVLLFQTNNT